MASLDSVTVLCVSPFSEDHRKLEAVLGHSNWRLNQAHSGIDAVSLLLDDPQPVVIMDAELPDRSWASLLDWTAELNPPRPRMIIASRLADDRLWQEVLDRGGYNVLGKPFDAREVYWVIRHAWLDWKAELERISHQANRLAVSAH